MGAIAREGLKRELWHQFNSREWQSEDIIEFLMGRMTEAQLEGAVKDLNSDDDEATITEENNE